MADPAYNIHVGTGNLGDKWCRDNTPGVVPDAEFWFLRQFNKLRENLVEKTETSSACGDISYFFDELYETDYYNVDGIGGPDILTIGVHYGGLIDNANPADKYLYIAVNCEPIVSDYESWSANSCWHDNAKRVYKIAPVKVEYDPESEFFKTTYNGKSENFVDVLVTDIGDNKDGCYEVLVKMQNGINIYFTAESCDNEPVPTAEKRTEEHY